MTSIRSRRTCAACRDQYADEPPWECVLYREEEDGSFTEVRCGAWTHKADCFRLHHAMCGMPEATQSRVVEFANRAAAAKAQWHGSASGPGL